MHKHKCNKCDHVADEKGFCPKDGSELAEVKSVSSDMDALLSKIGDIVTTKTQETLKSMGFDGTPDRKVMGDPKSADEKAAYAKGLLSEADSRMLNALPSEKQEIGRASCRERV